MKRSSPALVGLCLLALGCGDRGTTDSIDMNSPGAVAMGMVSDLKTPALKGLTVGNDPEGAVVLSSPATTPPGTTLLGEYPVGTVFTEVNGTRVRDAEHFRELTDGVFGRREELNLKMILNAR